MSDNVSPKESEVPPTEGCIKKPYHAPVLRVYGGLAQLTLKGTEGGDLSGKRDTDTDP